MKKTILAAALLSGFAMAGTAAAQDFDSRWYVTGSVGQNFQDNERGTEDAMFGAIGLGKRVTPSVAVDVELNFQNPEYVANSDMNWKQYGISADVRKFFMLGSNWQPYIVGGLGYQRHEQDMIPFAGAPMFTRKGGNVAAKAGLGLEAGTNVKVRAEVAYRADFDKDARQFDGSDKDTDHFGDVLASLGVVIPFGAAAVAPVIDAPIVAAPNCADLDDDGDGVNNCNDRCPGSQAGQTIGADGCPVPVAIDLRGVNFDFDKATLRRDSIDILNQAVEVMKRYPQLRAEVAGHTDLCGSDAYNQNLSERRARAVYDYLTANGIDASRLAGPNGYGESRPLENTPQTLPACK